MINDLVAALADALVARGARLATAESCTGGLIAAACTERPGSSDWFECGFVTYSNAAKTGSLDVPPALIAEHGAVSEAVVRAMVQGALRRSHADWAVAVSGVAGPGGGSPDKPVGTVWLAWCGPGIEAVEQHRFGGDRAEVRRATVERALRGLLDRLARVPA